MSEKMPFPPDFKEKLRKRYDALKSCYEDLCDEVLFTLRKALQATDIRIHSINARETKIKDFESFYNKVVSRKIMENQFEAVEDISGVRIICLYRADLSRIQKIILKNFEVISIDTSRTRTQAPFGYSSDHYTVKFGKSCSGARYDNIRELKCEIQVRTILMDAWATVSHHLDYKQEVDIPRELRTDFNALAGLFYVADTHFELFKRGVEEARAALTKAYRVGQFDLSKEVNLDSLLAYLRWKFPERRIKRVASDIIQELIQLGYKNISDLDKKVNQVASLLKELEVKDYGLEEWQPSWAPDGLIRVVLDLTDDHYFQRHAQFRKLAKEKKHPSANDIAYLKAMALIDEYRKKAQETKTDLS